MSVRDVHVLKSANFAKESIQARLVTAVSQTNLTCFSDTPGFLFQIVKVASFCSALAGTVTATVLVGGRVAASVTFTVGTEVNIPLSAVLANIRGKANEAITVQYTTNASGALTDGYVLIQYRPRLLAGEQGPV